MPLAWWLAGNGEWDSALPFDNYGGELWIKKTADALALSHIVHSALGAKGRGLRANGKDAVLRIEGAIAHIAYSQERASKTKTTKNKDQKTNQAKNDPLRRLWTCQCITAYGIWAPAAGCGVFLYMLSLRNILFCGDLFFLTDFLFPPKNKLSST
jgi:hypothetical protein